MNFFSFCLHKVNNQKCLWAKSSCSVICMKSISESILLCAVKVELMAPLEPRPLLLPHTEKHPLTSLKHLTFYNIMLMLFAEC